MFWSIGVSEAVKRLLIKSSHLDSPPDVSRGDEGGRRQRETKDVCALQWSHFLSGINLHSGGGDVRGEGGGSPPAVTFTNGGAAQRWLAFASQLEANEIYSQHEALCRRGDQLNITSPVCVWGRKHKTSSDNDFKWILYFSWTTDEMRPCLSLRERWRRLSLSLTPRVLLHVHVLHVLPICEMWTCVLRVRVLVLCCFVLTSCSLFQDVICSLLEVIVWMGNGQIFEIVIAL